MFRSATIRLTLWYLAVLMAISLIFSAIIYQITSNEIGQRLERFQTSLQYQERNENTQSRDITIDSDSRQILPPPSKIVTNLRNNEQKKARENLLLQIFYLNLLVLTFGGFMSYFLARWHLKPIERAHADQSRFTSDASHELRTPLAAIKTEIEVALKDRDITAKELREVLSSNLEEVNKLTELSSMLLNLSRLDSNKLQFEVVDFNKVVLDAIENHNPTKRHIKIKKDPKSRAVYANKAAVYDIVKILIDNAVKYSPEKSPIQVKLSYNHNQARFDISNSGVGIQPDQIPHVFERFYRADDSRTGGDSKSYGLGLALAKKMVDLHHGEITVTSTVNKITTFTFILPICKQVKIEPKR